jgi:putative transposase
MLRREGGVNLKLVRRLYRSLHRGPVAAATGLRERWSMDFVYDQLANGRVFRVLTVVHQWSRQSPLLEAVQRVTGADVAAALDCCPADGGLPQSITVDHGTEFTSQALDARAFARGVTLDVTRPGKPTDNGHIESFTARLRDECLNVHQLLSLDQARTFIEAWRIDYNPYRPHGSLGHLTPSGIRSTLSGNEYRRSRVILLWNCSLLSPGPKPLYSWCELYRNGTNVTATSFSCLNGPLIGACVSTALRESDRKWPHYERKESSGDHQQP